MDGFFSKFSGYDPKDDHMKKKSISIMSNNHDKSKIYHTHVQDLKHLFCFSVHVLTHPESMPQVER